MVKINNKRKLKYYLKDYDSGNSSQKSAAKALGVTPRRFRQIHERYKSTGEIPVIGVGLGRPKKDIPEKRREIIKEEYEMFRLNALYQEKTIYDKMQNKNTSQYNTQIMLEFGFAKE